MKHYKEVYMKEMGYCVQDYPLCEICERAEAVDIHHIDYRGMGGSPDLDIEGNLTGLCRHCHDVEENKVPNERPHSKEWLVWNHYRFKGKYHIN
jgi:hypothetical protein